MVDGATGPWSHPAGPVSGTPAADTAGSDRRNTRWRPSGVSGARRYGSCVWVRGPLVGGLEDDGCELGLMA